MSLIPSRRAGLLAVIATLFIFGAAQAQAVRVGSKIDTEGSLLGNLIVQVLEAGGVKTENKLQLGNTKIVRGALVAGEIDLYPEYTGNGAFFHADEKNPAWKSLAAGYERVKSLDCREEQAGLAATRAGQQHLGDRDPQGRGQRAEAEVARRLRPLGHGRRQGQAGGVGRVRRAPRRAAGVPDGLRLQADAGPVAGAGRRRHRGRRSRPRPSRPRVSTPRWPTAPTARWPRSAW